MSKRFAVTCVLVGVLAVALPAPASAQEEHRVEAVGGFSYLFADVGTGGGEASGPGFNGSFAFFINDWFGVGGEVGYNHGGLDIPTIQIFPSLEIDFSQWAVLFGPRFRIVDNERFRIGAQFMLGIAHAKVNLRLDPGPLPGQGPGPFAPFPIEVDSSETAAGVTLGLHFDLKINERMFWRIMQPEIMGTSYGNDGQGHFRITSGLGFEF